MKLKNVKVKVLKCLSMKLIEMTTRNVHLLIHEIKR